MNSLPEADEIPRCFSGFCPIAAKPQISHGVPVIEDGPQGLKEEVGDDTKQT